MYTGRLVKLVVVMVAGAGASQDSWGAEAASRSGTGAGTRIEERAYPTGDRATSIVLLQRTTPTEVRRGEEFDYEIRLLNLTRSRLSDLVLTEEIPATFRVTSINPAPTQKSGDHPTWAFRELAGGATQTIRVRGATDQPTELTWCATVTFNTVACAKTRIVEPKLALTKTQPATVMLCDDIPIRLVVTNTGDGVARRVIIDDRLPPGLATKEGRDSFALDAGDLASGQSRQFTVITRASKAGEYSNTARASESGGLQAESTASTRVIVPALAVDKRGPTMRYIGRPADFEITVRNTGDAPADDVILTDVLPTNCEFLAADHGGKLSNGRVIWSLGTLTAGATKSVRLSLNPTQIGTVTNSATVQAVCAEARAQASMDVRGIPAILLECEDNPDPVEIGTNTTYTIAVTNQGSATGTNINITCTVPRGESYLDAAGPTRATVEGTTIRFLALPTLAPKARATYKVTVKGVKTGDERFKVILTSDQTIAPVEETESTHIYE